MVLLQNQLNCYDFESIYKLFDIVNRLSYICDYEMLSVLLDLACKKNYYEFAEIILWNFSKRYFNIGHQVDPDKEPLNLLNSSVFVVRDINILIENVKKIGYCNINEGPQPWRGQINSISHFLSSIDTDYRINIYNHYKHHLELQANCRHKSTISGYTLHQEDIIPRSNFSFRNIHMNIGNVKW